jgi:hypothetical protein
MSFKWIGGKTLRAHANSKKTNHRIEEGIIHKNPPDSSNDKDIDTNTYAYAYAFIIKNLKEKGSLDKSQNDETFALEWSGSIELLTYHDASTEKVNKSVLKRIDNNKKFRPKNYRHFIALHLPNLTRTPRYQNKLLVTQKPTTRSTPSVIPLQSTHFKSIKTRKFRLKKRSLLSKKLMRRLVRKHHKKKFQYTKHQFFALKNAFLALKKGSVEMMPNKPERRRFSRF